MRRRLPMGIFGTLLALLLISPLLSLIALALWGPDGGGAALGTAWTNTLNSLLRSLWYGGWVALFSGASGWLLAWAVTFCRFPGRRALARLVLVPLLFPPFVVAGIYQELLSGTGPLSALIAPLGSSRELDPGTIYLLAQTVTLYPWVYLLCRLAFVRLGGAAWELGQSVGLSFGRATWTALVPLSLPALLLGSGLVMMETLSDTVTAATLSVDTVAVALHELWFNQEQPRLAARFGLLLVLAALALAWLLGRRLEFGRLRRLIRASGPPPELQQLSPGQGWLITLLFMVPVALGLLVPLATLLVHFHRTLDSVDLSPLFSVCASTLALVAAAGGMCLFFALSLTYLNTPRRPLLQGIWGWICLSYLVPAMVFAMAVLALTSHLLPFIERFSELVSFFILAFGLSLRFLCFLLIPIAVGLMHGSVRLGELAASLSLAGPTAFRRIHLPQLRPFLILGLLLLTIQVLRETTISVALHPFSAKPLALEIYGLTRIDMLPESAAWVLSLLLLGIYPLLTLERMLFDGRKRGAEQCSR